MITSGQRMLTKGRIAALSPLAVADGFVRPWPPSNEWFLGCWTHTSQPTNGILIGWAIFAGLTNLTNRHTDTETDRHTYRQTDRPMIVNRFFVVCLQPACDTVSSRLCRAIHRWTSRWYSAAVFFSETQSVVSTKGNLRPVPASNFVVYGFFVVFFYLFVWKLF